MTKVTIYHNPRCSKSRETLALLHDKNIEPEIVLYLDAPPSPAEINTLLQQLGFTSARQLLRKSEEIYQTLQLDNPDLSEAQLITAMSEHPKLIERPIVVYHHKAKLGRPPAQVIELFGE